MFVVGMQVMIYSYRTYCLSDPCQIEQVSQSEPLRKITIHVSKCACASQHGKRGKKKFKWNGYLNIWQDEEYFKMGILTVSV